jgi:hypothetical protein
MIVDERLHAENIIALSRVTGILAMFSVQVFTHSRDTGIDKGPEMCGLDGCVRGKAGMCCFSKHFFN